MHVLLPLIFMAAFAADAERCRIMEQYLVRHPGGVSVLAVATGQTVEVPVRPTEGSLTAGVEGVTRAVAHQFRVVESSGEGAPAPGEALLVVPWAYHTSCAPVAWTDEGWVAEGEEGVFGFNLDRVERFEFQGAEIPLVHTLGWHAPYPQGRFLGPTVGAGSDRSEWLSAREYMALLSAIPAMGPETSPAERLRRVEAVLQAGDPRWAVTFPGSEGLRQLRAAAAQATTERGGGR
jgi:hypothetical protein